MGGLVGACWKEDGGCGADDPLILLIRALRVSRSALGTLRVRQGLDHDRRGRVRETRKVLPAAFREWAGGIYRCENTPGPFPECWPHPLTLVDKRYVK